MHRRVHRVGYNLRHRLPRGHRLTAARSIAVRRARYGVQVVEYHDGGRALNRGRERGFHGGDGGSWVAAARSVHRPA